MHRLVLHVYIVHRLGIGAHHGSGLSHDIAHDALAGFPALLVPSCTGCPGPHCPCGSGPGAARSRLGSCSSRHPSSVRLYDLLRCHGHLRHPAFCVALGGLGAFGLTWLSRRTRTDAKLQGELLFDHAKAGVLAGLDEDDDFRIDDAAETAAVQAELASWLRDALHMKQPAASRLAQRLHAAGLTHARMVEASAHPGGFQTLCDVLASSSVGMRPGDALALASAAKCDSSKRDS